jgi:hypothetical protein
MRLAPVVAVALAALAPPALAGDLPATDGSQPRLDLAATPRMGVSPTTVSATAKLVGGDQLEDFHCPEVEWDWSDGARSTRLSDCDPYEPGAGIVRVFSASHRFRQPGRYVVTVSLRRAGRVLAAATVTVNVKQGFPAGY